MKPGRELDVLIAEKVMGWKLYCYEGDVYAHEPGQYGDAAKNDGWCWEGDTYPENRESHQFAPSTDIAAAWEVVEKLSTNGWAVKMQIGFDSSRYYWDCEVFIEESHYGSAKTAPHAICLAALKAAGVKL